MDRFAGAVYEPTDLILGVEPVYVMGALTIGSAALGWLAGPAIGGQIWKLLNRRTLPQFEAKEKGESSATPGRPHNMICLRGCQGGIGACRFATSAPRLTLTRRLLRAHQAQ